MSRNFLRTLGAVSRQCQPRRIPVASAVPRTTATPRLAAPLHTTPNRQREKTPKEPPPTNFEELDVLGNAPVPATAVDNCLETGFILNSGAQVTDGSGVLLANGEAFRWRPWEASGKKELVNKKGQFDVPGEAFGVLDLLWPRPGEFGEAFFAWRSFVASTGGMLTPLRSVDIRCRPAHFAS